MLRLLAQVAAAAIVAFIAYVLWFNLTNNLRAAGLPTGFDFLTQPLGVDIPGSDLSSGATIWRGLLVGIKNTLALVVVGIPLLTIIGVLVGVARLSTNWLVAKAAGLYVEILRNIPPLLIIYFVFNAVVLQFPVLQESLNLGDFLIVNNRYIAVVGFTAQPDFGPFLLIMAGALPHREPGSGGGEPGVRSGPVCITTASSGHSPFSRRSRSSASSPWAGRSGSPDRCSTGGPWRAGIRVWRRTGRSWLPWCSTPRPMWPRSCGGSILAVPKGQTEAANAIALSPFQRLRYVVMPQALRIAIPPIISQYLNYTKNTSLAIAIGYAEITRLTFQMIGNGQPAPQMIAILMGIYLGFSLVISLIVNLVNRRMQLVTR